MRDKEQILKTKKRNLRLQQTFHDWRKLNQPKILMTG